MNDDNKEALQSLYPFLHGEPRNESTEEELLDSVRQKSHDSLTCKQQFFQDNSKKLLNAAQLIANSYRNKGRLFSMGNGGSSCDAAHVAVEFQHPVTAGRPSLPAMNLTADMAMFSAVSNDIGVKHVFSRQVEAHAQPGDVLIGFSTSGNSENLMAAFHTAHAMGLKTIGFAGNTGGEMLSCNKLDCCLVVASDSIHRVQETHLCGYHILWDLVHTLLADKRGKLGNAL